LGPIVFNLATHLLKKGKFPEAEPLFRRALGIYERVLGTEHPKTIDAMGMMARSLEANGDLAGARSLVGRGHSIAAKALGDNHATTLRMKAHLDGLMMKFAPAYIN
jgi:hypothetical protein